MEAAGTMNIIPVGVIRGVCDYGDENKNKEWQPHAAAVAAAYAKALLGEIRPKQLEIIKPVNTKEDGILKACLATLRFSQMYQQMNSIYAPIENTNQWLLKHKKYHAWRTHDYMEEQGRLLWIKGKPGSGKSTIMKSTLSAIKMEEKETSAQVIAFFFNMSGTQQQRSSVAMYRSLIYQLANVDHSVQKVLLEIWKRKDETSEDIESGKCLWQQAELLSLLVLVFSSPSTRPTIIFIDALDECYDSEKSDYASQDARDIVSFCKELLHVAHVYGGRLKICLSSRSSFVVGDCDLEIVIDDFNRNDISTYIATRFRLHGLKFDAETVKLSNDIVQMSSGIFLWVKLTLDNLTKGLDRPNKVKYVRNNLFRLASDLNSLYTRMLQSPTFDEEEKLITIKFFQWIIYGARPFRLREWYTIAGLIREKPPKSFEGWTKSDHYPNDKEESNPGERLEQWIRSTSRGLVEVSKTSEGEDISDHASIAAEQGSLVSNFGENRTVQVIHASVREFFQEFGFGILAGKTLTRTEVVLEGHSNIIRSCIDYIKLEELDTLCQARREVYATTKSHSSDADLEKQLVASFSSAASSASSSSSDGEYESQPHYNHIPWVRINHEEGSIIGLTRIKPDTMEDHDELWRLKMTRWFENETPPDLKSLRYDLAPLREGSIASISKTIELLGNGDVTALLNYAVHEIFIHAGNELMQDMKAAWLSETFQSIWSRIVLLREDLRPGASFINFCVKADFGRLVIQLLVDDKFCESSVPHIFALACKEDSVQTTRQIVLYQVETLNKLNLGQRLFGTLAKSSRVYYDWVTLFPDLLEADNYNFPGGSIQSQILFDEWRIQCDTLQKAGTISTQQIHGLYSKLSRRVWPAACKLINLDVARALLDMEVNLDASTLQEIMKSLCTQPRTWSLSDLQLLSRLSKGSNLVEALHIACRVSDPDIALIRHLLLLGADPSQSDDSNQTALHMLCTTHCRYHTSHKDSWYTHPKLMDQAMIMVELLKNGAQVNSANGIGQTPADILSKPNRFFVLIPILLNYGARLDFKSRDHPPLWDLYIHCDNNLHVRFLQHLAKYDIATPRDRRGRTPLHDIASGNLEFAIDSACLTALECLVLQVGLDINATDDQGDTPLSMAAGAIWYVASNIRRKHILLVSKILELGADVRIPNSKNKQPLHQAARQAHTHIIEILVGRYQADLDVQDFAGNTPLHLAASTTANAPWYYEKIQEDRLQCVKHLLNAGANVLLSNSQGQTPLQAAKASEASPRVIKVLQDAEKDAIMENLKFG